MIWSTGSRILLCWAVGIASIGHVVDGDTFDAMLSVWIGITVKERIRLLDVDTPERGQAGYAEAREFTRKWLSEHQDGLFVMACKRDHFGRVLGRVSSKSGPTGLSQSLINAGMGK